jgi:hypothetical protein
MHSFDPNTKQNKCCEALIHEGQGHDTFGVVLGKAIGTSDALIAVSVHSPLAMFSASRASKANSFNGRRL